MSRRSDREVARYVLGDRTLIIEHDDDPPAPRDWGEEGSLFLTWHKKYSFGNRRESREAKSFDPSDHSGWDELRKELVREYAPAVILPVYMYDHGNVSLRTTPFGDRWDPGQIGFILIEKSRLIKKRVTPALRKKLEKQLADEVETYSDYVSGNAYGYILFGPDGDEIDSVWGYFGDSGIERILQNAFGKDWKKAKKVA